MDNQARSKNQDIFYLNLIINRLRNARSLFMIKF